MSEPSTEAGKRLLVALREIPRYNEPRQQAILRRRVTAIEAAAAAASVGATPPKGTRLVLVSLDLADFGTRTEDGRKLTAEWGEPDEHGWYVPTFTAVDDGKVVVDRSGIDADHPDCGDRFRCYKRGVDDEAEAPRD